VQKLCHFILIFVVLLLIFTSCSSIEGAQIVWENNLANESPPTFTRSPTITPTITPTRTLTPIPTPSSTPSPTPVRTTTLAFTGVIVPARCVQAAIDEKGDPNYIYDEVREILANADITVGAFNATMSDQVNHIGCQTTWDLVGGPENADALQKAGFDVMSVATNHIQDCGFTSCGDTAFFDTLKNFERVGIEHVGAGENLEKALNPVVIEANGTRFGFVSLGEINERVFADENTPGIAVLSDHNLEMAINAAREISDIVIVLPHSGPEDYPEVQPQQKYWARHAVEYGADLVVITHTHVLQGYQFLDEVPVFYSLGNFVFDQIWARDHQQGAILLVTYEDKELVNFEFIPTIVDQDGTVHLAVGDEKREVLGRLEDLAGDLIEGQ
jgi:poly-gamma-glutamate synthesis protein (capsule biosynthesis protein)